jgi:hypothetical protein
MSSQEVKTYKNDSLTETASFLVGKRKTVENDGSTHLKERCSCVGYNKQYLRLDIVGVEHSGEHMGSSSMVLKR